MPMACCHANFVADISLTRESSRGSKLVNPSHYSVTCEVLLFRTLLICSLVSQSVDRSFRWSVDGWLVLEKLMKRKINTDTPESFDECLYKQEIMLTT